jgi:tetratricopeptide (TPR) repeat protein
MKGGLWILVGVAAVSAAGVFAVTRLATDPQPPASIPEDLALRDRVEELVEEVERHREVLESLALRSGEPVRIRELERRMEALEGSLAARAAGEDTWDAGAVEPEVEPMTPESQALATARAAAKEKDFAGARDRYVELLKGNLTPETRAEALRDLGIVYRAMGELDRAEETLLELLRTADPDSMYVLEANYHLAQTKDRQGDHSTAITYMEEVLRSPRAAKLQTGLARIRIAEYSLRREDPDRARIELQQVYQDFRDTADPKERWLLGEARKIARGLPGR